MKKLLWAAFSLIIVTACNNHEAEVDQATRQRDSLAAIINQRDSSINDFLTSFNEIQANLDSVARKQNAISVNIDKQQGELKTSAKDRINENIAAINEMMNQNRDKIAELNRKLKSSGSRVAQFQKMVEALNNQLAQKDQELAQLNEKLNALTTQVDQLTTTLDQEKQHSATQAQTISEQTTQLHTAYYIVDNTKNLQNNKIIDRTGGLLGIGRTSKLSKNVDNTKFTKIDYTTLSMIPVGSKKAKFMTYHPSDSYALNKDPKGVIESITISNPEKFWGASKYLVVIKD
jgi:DNA repair exonuclease SbcCD ATPase subunit